MLRATNGHGASGKISSPVGAGGVNRHTDVRTVQTLLNKCGPAKLSVDGICGLQTVFAIQEFQKASRITPDGRIDPAGPSWHRLTARAAKDCAAPRCPIDLKSASTNDAGLKIIKEHEGDPKSHPPRGPYLTTYVCPAGKLTIGWGHTGPDVLQGKTIKATEAETLLKQDLFKFENGIRKLVNVPVSSDQFSALVSFTFNVGLANLEQSTLLNGKLNQGDYSGAADEFSKWIYATVQGTKQVLNGLKKRRERERELFLTP
jgi:lysozyme